MSPLPPLTPNSTFIFPPPPNQVNQGNMPGVQSTFLAMDTEEGVEVVWNELHFSDRKAFSAHEVRLRHAPPRSTPPLVTTA